jgi:hypothetical protein
MNRAMPLRSAPGSRKRASAKAVIAIQATGKSAISTKGARPA